MSRAAPNDHQMREVWGDCLQAEEEGSSKYPGMSYEQGIKAALEWVLGEGPHPLED